MEVDMRNCFLTQIHGMHVSPIERLKLNMKLLFSEVSDLFPFPHHNFHAFCVGLPRSGTHSIAYIFDKHFAAAHEPYYKEAIINIIDWDRRKYSKKRMRKILSFRDKALKLDMESSHYLHHIIDLLVEFPKSKFILTVREPMSWLESEVNQNYLTQDEDSWALLERFRYSKYNYEHEFANLKQIKNIYPIRSYLSYWKDHLRNVLSSVPSDRLLVIDTFDISKQLNNIASFIGVDSDALDITKKHVGKRKSAFNLYDNVDRNKIFELVQSHCRKFVEENLPLMSKYFDSSEQSLFLPDTLKAVA